MGTLCKSHTPIEQENILTPLLVHLCESSQGCHLGMDTPTRHNPPMISMTLLDNTVPMREPVSGSKTTSSDRGNRRCVAQCHPSYPLWVQGQRTHYNIAKVNTGGEIKRIERGCLGEEESLLSCLPQQQTPLTINRRRSPSNTHCSFVLQFTHSTSILNVHPNLLQNKPNQVRILQRCVQRIKHIALSAHM